MIPISRNDVIWSYLAQFFSVFSGLVTLPLILKLLTPDEVGLNYLLLSLGSLVALFDFGFAPQFARSLSYVYGGAQSLEKEGINTQNNTSLNLKLLVNLILTAKFIYKRIAFLVLFVMLTLGTLYIYKVTDGFNKINNILEIWVLYSFSVFFNLYYSYYTSLLMGKGMIKESKKANFFSKLAYIIFTYIFLFSGLGLFGVVLANFLFPFISRYISNRYFFTKEFKLNISGITITKNEKIILFKTIWYNSKKLGLVFVGTYAINKLSIFLAGIYLNLSEIGSYGLMIQIYSLLFVMSNMLFTIHQPRFSSMRAKGEKNELIKEFSLTTYTFYILFIIGSFSIIYLAPFLLRLIGSSTILPTTIILVTYSIVLLLEGNHSIFASIIVTDNKVPFVVPSLIAGFSIALGDFIILKYSSLSILGLVLVQGVVQLAYANWKWPIYALKTLEISFSSFYFIGFNELKKYIKI